MNIGIFTDTFEPQINGVVTSIKTSIEYLERNHTVYVFCPNVKPKVKSSENVWRFPKGVMLVTMVSLPPGYHQLQVLRWLAGEVPVLGLRMGHCGF